MKVLILLALIFTSASAFAEWMDESEFDHQNLCSIQTCQKNDRGLEFHKQCQFWEHIPSPGDPNTYEVVRIVPSCVCPCNTDYLGYQEPYPGQEAVNE